MDLTVFGSSGGGGATLSIAELNRKDPRTLLFVGVDLNAELEYDNRCTRQSSSCLTYLLGAGP